MVGGERIRRNSLTTLHSMPAASTVEGHRALGRQTSVPHGYNVCIQLSMCSNNASWVAGWMGLLDEDAAVDVAVSKGFNSVVNLKDHH